MGRRKKQEEEAAVEEDVADTAAAQEALLSAVEDGEENDFRPFLSLFVSSNATAFIRSGISVREQRKLLLAAINGLHKPVARRFFSALGSLVKAVLEDEEFVPSSMSGDYGDDDDDDDEEVVPDRKSSDALQFLFFATQAVQAYLDGLCEKHTNPNAVLQVLEEVSDIALSLHDVLFRLDSCGPDAVAPRQAIVSLCESWWLNNAANREQFLLQALPVLVRQAVTEGASVGTVKRLFAIREAFDCFDWLDPESDEFVQLLTRLSSVPGSLRSSEGKRFLSYLMSTDVTLMKALHQSFRAQIPDNKKTALAAYGDIYFRAWKEADDGGGDDEGVMRDALEQHVLQDLMVAVLQIKRNSMNQALLQVLQPFHDAKKNAQVEQLLHRMYGPILWRSLEASNAQVRWNAIQVLAEVFPLRDGVPSSNSAAAVNKACVALKNGLTDPDARVRVAAATAAAKILTMYWDVVPVKDIRDILNHLVAEHASDASSSAVRVGALNAVTLMLATKQSHAVLRPLLPSLGNLIHDRVEKVRLATVQMLLQIKKTPGIKYYRVVPVDHLILRLAEEGERSPTNSVASALTSLMLNSYFPQGPNISGVQQINRTLTFLTNDPEAARVFYANVASHLPVSLVAKLTAMLLRCLHAAVENDQQREREAEQTSKSNSGRKRVQFRDSSNAGDDDDEKEDEKGNGDAGEGISASDTALMANLADTICVLWESIEDELEADEECNKFLVDEFSGSTLTNALTHFERKAAMAESEGTDARTIVQEECYRTCAAILRTAGRIPAKAVEGLVPYIASVLESLTDTDDSRTSQNVTAHIALLCLWDMSEKVASSLAASIESAFPSVQGSIFGSPLSDPRKRRSARTMKESDLRVPELPARMALKVLGDILRGSDPSSVAAREFILCSNTASRLIEQALEKGTKCAERVLAGDPIYAQSLSDTDIDVLLQICEGFGRFHLHKEASTKGAISFSEDAERLLQWTTNKVVPAFRGTMRAEGTPGASHTAPFHDPDLSTIPHEKSFDLPSSPTLVGPPSRRANRNRTPVRLDDGSMLYSSPVGDELSVNPVRRAFAVSLMHSSCVIFSERLAVGGSGASNIAKAAVAWTEVFHGEDEASQIQKELLPAFSRLALQLAKTSMNFSLLKQLLMKCKDDIDDYLSAVQEIISSLVSTRGNDAAAIVLGTVDCMLEAAYELLEDEEVTMSNDLSASLGTAWEGDMGCIRSCLRSILWSKPASLQLARHLVENFAENSKESAKRVLFDAKCLWILCDTEGPSKVTADAAALVRDMNANDFEGDLEDVVNELVGGITT